MSTTPSVEELVGLQRAIDVLVTLPGLTGADASTVAALARQFDEVHFADDDLICAEGSPAETLYVLAKGQVDVRKRSISGNEHSMTTLQAPCLFGHVGVLSLAQRTASVVAHGDVTLLQMSARRARVVLRTGTFAVASPFRRALIVAMCTQLTSATASVAELAVDAKVSEEWHTPPDGQLSLGPTKQDLDDHDAQDSILPEDAEERLMKGLSQV